MNFCNNFAVDIFTTGGTFIGNCSSINEAAKATGHSDSTIRKWCMNNKNGWSKK